MTRQPIATTIPFSDPDAFEDAYLDDVTGDEEDSLDVGDEIAGCPHPFHTSCEETVCPFCGKVAWR